MLKFAILVTDMGEFANLVFNRCHILRFQFEDLPGLKPIGHVKDRIDILAVLFSWFALQRSIIQRIFQSAHGFCQPIPCLSHDSLLLWSWT